MLHGVRAGQDFVSMHCKQCQGHTNTFQWCSSQTCNTNIPQAWQELDGFGEDHRKCSHCGDCHIFATPRVGAQQGHSLNERKKNFPEWTRWIEWCRCMHMNPSVQRWNKFLSSSITSHFRQKATKLPSETHNYHCPLSNWTFSILDICLIMTEITSGNHSCKFYLGGQRDLEVLEIQEDLDHQCQGCLVGLEVLVVHLVQGHLREHSCLVKYWTHFRDICFQRRVPAYCIGNLILAS